MNSSISAVNSANICFIYFEAMLLGVYTFGTDMSPEELFCYYLIFLFISSNALHFQAMVPILH